jgi:predicted transcriptional regulator
MQNVKEGFSFGAGAHLARHLIDRVFGSSTPTPTSVPTPVQSAVPISTAVDSTKSIGADQLLYHKCMQDGGKHETCKEYLV